MDKKQQTTELWRACFNDDEEFIRFYFDCKYNDENTLIFTDTNVAVAALQILPYPISWCDTEITTSYISGACTLPEVRNKGIMKKLLSDAFILMRNRHIALSTLIPAEPRLFDYYRKTGYTTVFEYALEQYDLNPEVKNDTTNTSSIKDDLQNSKNIYPWFAQKMKERNCCIQHSFDDFRCILQDLHMNAGKLIAAYTPAGKPSGLAFALPAGNKIRVNDFLYDSVAVKQTLLQAIAHEWGNGRIECKIPTSAKEAVPGGMARIIDAEQMLSLYASRYPEKKFSLKLTDNELPSNTGIYRLGNGSCSKSISSTGKTDFEVDIPILTQALLGYHLEQLPTEYSIFDKQQPFMSLMLD